MFDDVQRVLQRALIYDQLCELTDQLHQLLAQWFDNDPEMLAHEGLATPDDDTQLDLPLDAPDEDDIPF